MRAVLLATPFAGGGPAERRPGALAQRGVRREPARIPAWCALRCAVQCMDHTSLTGLSKMLGGPKSCIDMQHMSNAPSINAAGRGWL